MTASESTSPPPPAAPRRRRWLRRVLVAVAVFLAAMAAVVVLAIRSLDRPYLKGRIQALAREAAGVDLDYRATHLSLSGLRIEGLVVLSPEPLRPVAPELARVGVLEARWTIGSLRGEEGPLLKALSLEDVAVTLVSDARRGTSLGLLSSSPDPAPPEPETPLSRQLADALASAPPVARLDLARARVIWVSADDGRELERVSLGGIGLGLDVEPEPAGGWKVAADAGTRESPLELALERSGQGRARLRLALGAKANPSRVQASVDVGVVEQTLVQGLVVEQLLRLEAAARFDPKAGRVELSVAQLEAADGSVSAQAALVLPDKDGAPLLEEAKGDVDLAKALRHVPQGLVAIPVELAGGKLSFQVRQLSLAALPSLAESGFAQVEASAQNLRVSLTDGRLESPAAGLSLKVQPKSGGLGGQASVTLEKLQLALAAQRIEGDGVGLTVDGSRAADGAIDASVDLQWKRLAAAVGASLNVAAARIGLKAKGFHLDSAAPLASRGRLELDVKAATVGASSAPWRVAASEVGLAVQAALTGKAPYAVDLDLPVGKLEVSGAKDRSYLSAPLRLRVGLKEAYPDLDRPLRTRGLAKVGLDLGALRASLDLTKKEEDAADYTLTASASSLAAVKPLLSENAGWQVPWDQVALALSSSGRAEKLSSKAPRLSQRAELRVDKPGLTLSAGAGGADQVLLTLRSDGSATQHSLDLDLAVRKLVLGEKSHGDSQLALSGAVDLGAPSVRLDLKGSGEAGPTAAVTLSAAFDRAKKALSYDLSASLSRLAPLAPLLAARGNLAGFDLAALDAALTARGAHTGVVEDVAADGTVRLAPKPIATLGGESRLEVRLAGFGWKGGDQAFRVPAGGLQVTVKSEGGRHTLSGDMTAESARLAFGRNVVELAGVSDSFELTTSDPAAGEAELRQKLKLRAVGQTALPAYPVGELTLTLHATRDREGTVHASLVQLDNGAAGTSLKLQGSAELGGYRRSLSLRGDLEQDLAKAWTDKAVFEGKGRLALKLSVDSSDLRVFHTDAQARFTGADLTLRGAGVTIESLDAEIPAQADFVMGANGLSLRPQTGGNAFSQLRFADQHPFQSRRSFLSIAKLTSPAGTMAPLAGNLEIAKGVVLLSQLELGVRKGLVTGQCALILGKDPTVVARIRASGLESSYGEPFDGNLAISISTKDRRVDGRAEILRIGRRHLLDLLDFQDPYRADGSLNQIRTALALGYPDHVRLGFRQGFASLAVTFGGAASVVKLDEIRGIPVGPLMDKVLASSTKKSEP